MTLSGGAPGEWLAPWPEQARQTGEYGTHRGPARSLNVHNPQDGMVYYYGRHPRTDRGNQLQRLVNSGWEVVPPDAPEHMGRENRLNYSAMGLDNYQVHGDVILMRIPEEQYREISEWRASSRAAAMSGPTEDYESRGAVLEERFGARADGPIYYKAPGHGISGK